MFQRLSWTIKRVLQFSKSAGEIFKGCKKTAVEYKTGLKFQEEQNLEMKKMVKKHVVRQEIFLLSFIHNLLHAAQEHQN